jgi:hypothetical protein
VVLFIKVPPNKKADVVQHPEVFTGEEVILFTLAESAHYREIKKK